MLLFSYPGNLSPGRHVSWLANTTVTVIYTTTGWWSDCTGNSDKFQNNNPLWIADWSSSVGSLPAGWDYYSFWQYADSGQNPGDPDVWNGDLDGLKRYVSIGVKRHCKPTRFHNSMAKGS